MEIFQTFAHNGKILQLATYESATASRPAQTVSMRPPGAGDFEIGPLSLSADKIGAGEELTLTAQVSGENIAFIYTEILLRDPHREQFYGPVAQEYVQAQRSKEIGGVSHPDWDAAISVSVRLSPSLRLLTDGVDFAFGFLSPADYGSFDTWLDGIYTAADGETQRRARLSFDSAGAITQAVAYKGRSGSAAPHALTFKSGDQFTPFVQILTPPTAENPAWQVTTALSTPLSFRGQPFCWVKETLIPGDYLVGLLVQDMDGGLTRQYASLRYED